MKRVFLVGANRIHPSRHALMSMLGHFRVYAEHTMEGDKPWGKVEVIDVDRAEDAISAARSSPDEAKIIFFEHDPLSDYPCFTKDTIVSLGRNDEVVVLRDQLPLHQVHEIPVYWAVEMSLQRVMFP